MGLDIIPLFFYFIRTITSTLFVELDTSSTSFSHPSSLTAHTNKRGSENTLISALDAVFTCSNNSEE